MKTKIEKIGGKKVVTVFYKQQSFKLEYCGYTHKELKWYKSMFDKMIEAFKNDLLGQKSETSESNAILPDVMERSIQFMLWSKRKYSHNVGCRLYTTTFDLEHGEGISYDDAYRLFDTENAP